MKIVFATNNQSKLKEVREIIPIGIEILSLKDIGFFDEIKETGTSYEENAQIKTKYISNKYSIDCFADDSGLEVPCLNGAPGIYSARFAGTPKNDINNIKKLKEKLKKKTKPLAYFKTVISLNINKENIFFKGKIKGYISKETKGINGFGYDPIFIPDGYDKTFGEISSKIKNKISHRAIAIRKLVEFFKNNFF